MNLFSSIGPNMTAIILMALAIGLTAAQTCSTLHSGEVPDRYYAVNSPLGSNLTGVTTIKMRLGDRTKQTDEILWVADLTGMQYRPMVLIVRIFLLSLSATQ